MRDPFDAILAEFNHLQVKNNEGRMSHIGHATVDKFRGNWTLEARESVPGCSSFECFAKEMAKRWEESNMACIDIFRKSPEHLLSISYEELVLNTEKELSKVLHFLNVSSSDTSMRCAIDRKEGIFHRSKDMAIDIPIYSQEVTRIIKCKKTIVYNKLGLPYPYSTEETLKNRKK